MNRYILATYKIENGFMKDFKVREYSNDKERLLYIAESERFNEEIKHGYTIAIYEENVTL